MEEGSQIGRGGDCRFAAQQISHFIWQAEKVDVNIFIVSNKDASRGG